MRYQPITITQRHLQAIEFEKKLLGFQVSKILKLIVSGLVVWAITVIWPNLFPYTYFSWTTSVEVLTGFWPLAVYGLVLLIWDQSTGGVASSVYDEELLGWGVLTGWVAAIWEEVAYRWLFICFGMITIVVMNWIFGTVLGWVLAIAFGFAALAQFAKDEYLAAFMALLVTVLFVLFALQADPMYWLYGSVLMPLLNILSLGSYSNIVDSTQYPSLLVMGAILANFWFRDGHKYQGPFGLVNSMFLGFVLLYAMFTYGLMTAIVLHGLWNSYMAVLEYSSRKIKYLR